MKKLLSILSIVASVCCNAQLVVTPAGGNYNQLVQNNLVGAGVTISNVQYTGAATQIGSFTAGGNTNLGLTSGIVMATGDISNTPGAASAGMSNNLNGAGVAELTTIAGVQTRDGAVLQFDVLPQANTITFKYVFASEEWPENPNPNSTYYDAFAFFISGPGFPVPTNVALLPSSQPVSIATVNTTTNTQYYVDNSGSTTIKFDGLTTVLTATAQVQPCQTYTLKLMIADAVNGFKDTGVFLEAGSLSSTTLTVASAQALPANGISEGCTPATINFTLPTALPQNVTLNYTTGGNATAGTDYTPLQGSITIPAGQTQASLQLTALQDGAVEALPDTFKLIYTLACITDTLEILINDALPLQVNAGSDITLCQSQQVNIQPQVTGGSGNLTYAWTENNTAYSTVQNISPTPTGAQTNYILTVTDACGNTGKDTVVITVGGNVTATFADNGPVCSNTPLIISYTGTADTTTAQFSWNFTAGTVTSQQGQVYNLNFALAGTYFVSLTVTSPGCQPVSYNQQVIITPSPLAPFTVPPGQCLSGNSFSFNTQNSNPGATYSWNFGPNATPATSTNATPTGVVFNTVGTQAVTVSVERNGCIDTYTDNVTITQSPIVTFTADVTQGCAPLTVTFTDQSGIPAADYQWDFGDGITSAQQTPTHQYVSGGIYEVSLWVTVNGQQCKGNLTQPAMINVAAAPQASFIATPPVTTEFDPNFTLTSTATGATNISYILPDGSILNTTNAEISFVDTGNYVITQIADNGLGCADTAYTTVRVGPLISLYLPNAFTPDGDNINDIFNASGYGITQYQMNIYNRWGTLVYSTASLQYGWDGKLNGIKCPVDAYIYKVTYQTADPNSTPQKIIGRVSIIK